MKYKATRYLVLSIIILSMVLMLPPKTSAEYCIRNRTVASLVLDRESDRDTVSVAACGFAMGNWAVLVEQGKIDHDTVVIWCNQSLDSLQQHNPPKNRGWLTHFTDSVGRPLPHIEVSTVDTAIYYLGARYAASILKDQILIARVEKDIKSIDIEWMRRGKYICHGFMWKEEIPEFIACTWDDYSEGVLVYKLFNIPYKPRRVEYNLPLFVYFYPLCFYDDPEMREHLNQAVIYQKQTYKMWGVTSCDAPEGYQANRLDIISPLAIYTIAPLVPEADAYLKSITVPPETAAWQPTTGWISKDRLGIDDGCCVLIWHRYAH